MPPISKAWHLNVADAAAARTLAERANVSEVVASLLLRRGIQTPDDARFFLEAPVSALHSPHLIPGVDAAVERIFAAVQAKKSICVYGDYDVDGTTGTTILWHILHKLGAKVQFYIPVRAEEGYGLNSERIRTLAEEGVQLLITVDCGITSVAEADLARELGVELIITDHHEMKAELPRASVLVHPQLHGTTYPFFGLSGSCVAFKLAWALATRICGSDKVTPEWREFLLDAMGVAALGLIADVMPLRDENRIFVRFGLGRVLNQPSVGLNALLEAAQLKSAKLLKAEDVAFRLAPRINAAGRLGLARFVVELLTTTDPIKARERAEYLEKQNSERQAIERKILQEVKSLVEDAGYHNDPAIVLGSKDWHPGVIGIVAGRIVELYGKPVLIAGAQEQREAWNGSGRTIPGFALNVGLQACDDLLLRHGGHAMAAGFQVLPENFDRLRERFIAEVRKTFPDGPPLPRLHLDTEVPLSALTFKMLKELDKLEPYGAENPRPRFLASGLTIEGKPRRIGTNERHLSFRVRQGEVALRAVGWGMGERLDELMSGGGQVSLAFSPKINSWNDYESVEIEVHDFQPQATPTLA